MVWSSCENPLFQSLRWRPVRTGMQLWGKPCSELAKEKQRSRKLTVLSTAICMAANNYFLRGEGGNYKIRGWELAAEGTCICLWSLCTGGCWACWAWPREPSRQRPVQEHQRLSTFRGNRPTEPGLGGLSGRSYWKHWVETPGKQKRMARAQCSTTISSTKDGTVWMILFLQDRSLAWDSCKRDKISSSAIATNTAQFSTRNKSGLILQYRRSN